MKPFYILIMSVVVMSCVSKKQPAMPTPDLHTATAVERRVPNTVEFISQTQPTRSYIIQPRVNGFLRSIDFNSGLPVKKGQLLFTIDSAPFKTHVVEARAALASAKAGLVQARAAYDRSVPLAKINAISQSQLDGAIATLASAREQVESSQALLDNALINLGYCTIKSPASGVIASSAANVGEYVGVGTAYQTLTTVSFDDSVNVDLSLPTVEYYKIVSHNLPSYQGDSLLRDITLKLSDGTIYPHKGIYQYTLPLVNNESGSIVFNVRFPNPNALLKGGQFARVTASVGDPQLCVLIPARAVSEVQGVYGAYVVDKNNILEFRELSVGQVVDSEWVILSGIKAGEKVITEGMQKAKSGMKIKPIEK